MAKCAVSIIAKKEDAAGFECFVKAVEKKTAGARCCSKVPEKNDPSFECFVEKHDVGSECIASCVVSIVAKKQDVGSECFVKSVEKKSAGARCCSKVPEKNDASFECFVEDVEKHGAGARCFCMVVEKNGGCGNVMKSANENVPLAEALNGVVAA